MNTSPILERVNILLQQARYQEAIKYLEQHLGDFPEDHSCKYLFAFALFRNGDNDKSRKIVDQLLELEPETTHLLELSVAIDIDDGNYKKAESKTEILLEQNPNSPDANLLMAQTKLAQRNYDKSLFYVKKSLEFDPENLNALNLKISLEGLLGYQSTENNLQDALELDAENPSSIANHGMQLLRQGKTEEALERLKYALSKDPNNYMAKMAMTEALKSKFPPYRLFFKYKEFSSRLTQNGSWTLVIGSYIVYRFLSKLAQKNEALAPFLYPIVYLIAILFFLTWVVNPLMNLYLLTNKYGRILLDEDEKKMAKFCGISLIIAIVAIIIYGITSIDNLLFIAIVGAIGLLYFGTYLIPTIDENRKKTSIYTYTALTIGITGAITGLMPLLFIFALGTFIYQWFINGILISENSRVID